MVTMNAFVLALTMLLAGAPEPATTPATAPEKAAVPAPNPALPPDAEGAKDALGKSPRHGEWVDVALPDGKKLVTWVVYPEKKEKAGVVIVIHEVFGLTDWVRGVADQLAKEGFIALAPDLLSGMGPNGGGTDSLGEDAVKTIRSIPQDSLSALAEQVAAYCAELDRCFLIPIERMDGRTMIALRIDATRNGQQAGVTMASQYDLGAIAQLEERLHGMQEVAGSSPASSIAV